jgi:hypothetical protein
MNDLVYRAYLRLAGKIINRDVKFCRVCGAVLDDKYKKRHNGLICLSCLRRHRKGLK